MFKKILGKDIQKTFKNAVDNTLKTADKVAETGKGLGRNLTEKFSGGAKATGDTAKKVADAAKKPVNGVTGRIKDDIQAQKKHSTGSGIIDFLAPFAPPRNDNDKDAPAKSKPPAQAPRKK